MRNAVWMLLVIGFAAAGPFMRPVQAADSSVTAAVASDETDTDGITYGVGTWNEGGFGNQRAVVRVDGAAGAVWAHLPWRRQDVAPQDKAVVVFDSRGRQVFNVVRGSINREAGDIAFEPTDGAGEYFVYFMPNGKLASLKPIADDAWLKANALNAAGDALTASMKHLPAAALVRFEARSDFDRRDPMELIVTKNEVSDLLARFADSDYLVFPEDRRHSTRMFNDLPYRWIRRGPSDHFAGEAAPDEYYPFQLGVYACRKAIADIGVQISDLTGPGGAVIPAGSILCINSGGVDWAGRDFVKKIVIGLGTVKALWFVVEVPRTAAAGTYRGTVKLSPIGADGAASLTPQVVSVDITVAGGPVAEHGCLDAWRLSRLGWLDSTKGEQDTVIAPYTPVTWRGDTAAILNRSVKFDAMGLPQQITSCDQPLLVSPATFTIEGDGGPVKFAPGRQSVDTEKQSLVTHTWVNRTDDWQMDVQATVESDGCVEYRIRLKAERNCDTQDIALDIPMRSDVAQYFMGLGLRGGWTPAKVRWKWDVNRITNKLWTGNAVGGLIVDLMHNRDVWPTTFNYHAWGVPTSWDNAGRGGCDVTHDPTVTRIHAYCGPRSWKAGEEADFHFRLLVTPFKPIDMTQFRYRYADKYQRQWQESGGPKIGVTIAHTHHAMAGINPWINYPFLTLDAMKAYRDRLLKEGYKGMDVYYTMREISNHMSEIWALRSLDDEIFIPNEAITYDTHGGRVFKGGGGYSWLQEHLLTGYAPAWSVAVGGTIDAAIATQGLSRLDNFYVEGLDLLMKRVGVKGLYLDGIGYNRLTMKRVARVMASHAPDYRIKMHSGNNFDYGGWHCNSLLFYGELLPYVTDLYIGEGYSYNTPPDYWFVEMSGIPFGLTNEMLGGNSNAWRGMVYGMDSRENGASPALWKLWDSFGIEQSKMVGYWDPHCPVKTDDKDILATVFRRPGKALIAVASWSAQPRMCHLSIDFKSLGLDPQKVRFYAPPLENFQPAADAAVTDAIPIMPGRGWLLLLDEQPHDAPLFQIADAYKGRPMLLEDSFDRGQLGEKWTTHVSAAQHASLKLDRDSLAIQAPANCFAFAEHPLPQGCALAQSMIFSGTDTGASWGPGMSLVWKDSALRINLRADGHLGIDDGRNQVLVGETKPNEWYHVRFRLEAKTILVEISTGGQLWWTLQSVPRGSFAGDPIAVRLGKMNAQSQAGDFSTPGPRGDCALKQLRIYGTAAK